MKKLFTVIAVVMIAACGTYGAYKNMSATIAAGELSATLTNNDRSVWLVQDAYGLGSTNAAGVVTVTLTKTVSEGDLFIDSSTIASNGTSLYINIDGMLVVPPGTSIKFTRTAVSTNTSVAVYAVVDTQL